MNIKKILIIAILIFTNSNTVHSLEADIFVQSTVNRASQILSKNISKKDKISELKSIAKETVDIRGVGLYSLGAARKSLDEDQKAVLKNKSNELILNLCEINKDLFICNKSEK